MLNRLSLRARLVILTTLITGLVLSSAAFFAYQASARTVSSESQRYAVQLASTAADQINKRFERIIDDVHILSAMVQTLDGPPETRRERAAQIAQLMLSANPDRFDMWLFFEPRFFPDRYFANIWYIRTPDGTLTPTYVNVPEDPGYDPKQPLYDYHKQDWYKQGIVASDVVWTEPYLDEGGSDIILVTAVMSARLNGQIVGTVGSDFKLDDINTFIGTVKPTPGSYAMLVSKAGMIVAHPRRSELVLQSTLDDLAAQTNSEELRQLRTELSAGNQGVLPMRDPISGQEVLATYHPVSSTGWSLIIMTPLADLDAPLSQLRTTLTAIQMAALALLALAIWLMAFSLLRPIGLLLNETKRLATGERGTVQLGIRRGDELGLLAREFERMATQITESHSSLEEQVAARTQDLRQALEQRDEQTRSLSTALNEVQKKEQEIEALSTPIVPLLHDTLVVPIVGTLDSRRAGTLIQSLLDMISSHRARVVVLDVTGLPVVDTDVARTLMDAASAAQLLGTEVVLVGIRPEVAQTLVSLGVDFHNLRTLADLQAAVIYSLGQSKSKHPARS
ncbi:MAG TPA: cache domain-containing protein [Roseiflexaceae bacterium]|nr:cache domain-containing protein [Roseiflexaceae bacterium]